MDNKDTGLLINEQDIKLHRQYFEEMVALQGVKAKYQCPLKDGKERNLYGEVNALYTEPTDVGVIFEEHPTVWTMRKLGWDSELNSERSVIHVPYDLKGLQAGCLFILPPGTDIGEHRVFKVYRMSTRYIYPASVACEIGPTFKNNMVEADIRDFSKTNFNILRDDEEDD